MMASHACFSICIIILADYEKEILDNWEIVPPKSEEVLFIGCAGRENSIWHRILVRDERPCKIRAHALPAAGELYYRFGDYKGFSKRVDDTLALFEGLDTKRLVCYCGSCANFMGNVWPNYHGVKLPFEVTTIWEWLWERVKKGELKVQRQLSGKVAVTDSCYSGELGDKFFEAVRGLNKAIGLDVVELKNNRYNGLSCGFCTVTRNFDMADVMVEAKKKVDQILDTGAGDFTTHCVGCYDLLSKVTKGTGLRPHYGLEDILWALGDENAIPFSHRVAVQEMLIAKRFAPPPA
jgi:hypothetical protein